MYRAVIVAVVFLLMTGCGTTASGSTREIQSGNLKMATHTRADFTSAWGAPSLKETKVENRTVLSSRDRRPSVRPMTIEVWTYKYRNVSIDFDKSGKLVGFSPIDHYKPVRYEK